MRIDPHTSFWVVTDPGPHSQLSDICFETTLDGLRLRFAGGLATEQNPTVFTTADEAREDAKLRLMARRLADRVRTEMPFAAAEDGRWIPHREIR